MRILTLVFSALLFPAEAVLADDSPRLTVTGMAEVAAAPDMAMLRLGVVREARSAQAAMAGVSSDMGAILDRLGAAGIAPRDLQTSGLDLSPVWSSHDSGQRREITGFRAANTLSVRVRGLEGLGELLDQVIGEGANSFEGIGFGLQDPASARDEARRQAVADAMRKARLYAEAAGHDLGALVSISETGTAQPVPMMMEAARLSAPVPVAAGEVTLSARVTMVFELAN
ncbi:hypothetical protein EV663_10724 [Rhodovulum bhavnagarense]|uniref:Secreted protein n=1 Tax=Rhodovulum bhavnagarense TaxID=992286 RepID=A0A4R2RBW9_9RHOB|nr:SIMPL domain-containing protein [Rhodovulum bhavnagarense]TCP60850.1 hypothetical protein EV663_10724 [Rhodovulum bhavnagarense]